MKEYTKVKNKKKIVYVDMDGVLVDYDIVDYNIDLTNRFLEMKPLNDAISMFKRLIESDKYEIYILSTAPYDIPTAWTEKRLWCEKYLGESVYKRVIFSNNKGLLNGDYLIDDRLKNGVTEFKGKHIHFGQNEFKTWGDVLKYLNV